MTTFSLRRQAKLQLEALEDRTLPASFAPSIFTDSAAAGSGSLRAAVMAANGNGQDDVIQLQAGTYKLSIANSGGQENAAAKGDLDLAESNHTVTIQGAGAGITTIDGGLIDRVFQVLPNVTVVFRNLTITGGNAVDNGTTAALPLKTDAQGGGILTGGTVTLDHVSMTANYAILNPTATTGTNGVSGKGGGIYQSAGSLTVLDSDLSYNKANGQNGSNGAASSGQAGFAGGEADGGGIFIAGGSATIVNSSLASNIANGGRGGNGGSGIPGLIGTAGGRGGNGGRGLGAGIFIQSGSVSISSSIIFWGFANGGAGGFGGNGGESTSQDWADSGGSGGSGGTGGIAVAAGVFLASGTFQVSNSTLATNTNTGGAGGKGGNGGVGVFHFGYGGDGGVAGSGLGAGMYLSSGTVTLHNSTVAFNHNGTSLGGDGGTGRSPGTRGQDALGYGAGIYNTVGSLNAVSTIFAENRRGPGTAVEGTGTEDDVFGNFASASHNLLQSGAGSNLPAANPDANGNRVGTNAAQLSPGLLPLGFYGGPTRTYALAPGSIAIDAGANPDGLTTDQRGYGPRAVGGAADIGAFEFGALARIVVAPVPPPTPSPISNPLIARLARLKGKAVVNLFDAVTGARRGQLSPFAGYRGKMEIKMTDLDGDGMADVIITAMQGGKQRKRAYSARDLSDITRLLGDK